MAANGLLKLKAWAIRTRQKTHDIVRRAGRYFSHSDENGCSIGLMA
jgi:hypothetical protein